MSEELRKAIDAAVLAFQRIEMAHPRSDEHARDMYVTAETARLGLMKAAEKEK